MRGAETLSCPARAGDTASDAWPRGRRHRGGRGVAARCRVVTIPGIPRLPDVWDMPYTAWPSVRTAGGTPSGGPGHARERGGGGVPLRPQGHRPGGVGHVRARRPLAGGIGGRVPGRSPVAFSAHAGVPGPTCCLPACSRRGGTPPSVSAWCPGSLPGVGRRVGPRWGRVSAPVVTGPVRRSGGRVVCGGCVGTGGTPASGGTGRVPARGVVPIPPLTSGCKRRPEASAPLPLLAAPEPQR
jgi:hypothetical protein